MRVLTEQELIAIQGGNKDIIMGGGVVFPLVLGLLNKEVFSLSLESLGIIAAAFTVGAALTHAACLTLGISQP